MKSSTDEGKGQASFLFFKELEQTIQTSLEIWLEEK